jgi:hypothetical protein
MKFLNLKVIFVCGACLPVLPAVTLAEESGACRYTAAGLQSWKDLINRQIKRRDPENSDRLGKVASDIIDGRSEQVFEEMRGIDPNIPLKLAGGDMTILALAVAACRPEIAQYLVIAGASPDGNSTSVPLVTAAAKGEGDLVEFLIGRGANIEKADASGMSALEAAVRQRQLGVVSSLLTHGSRVNEKLSNGATLLDIVGHSSDSTDQAIAKELRSYGAITGLTDSSPAQ